MYTYHRTSKDLSFMSEFTKQSIQTILSHTLSPELTAWEVSILNTLPIAQAVPLLYTTFADARDNFVASRAFCALMHIGAVNKVQFLRAWLYHSSTAWRVIYCQALARFSDPRVLSLLCELYRKESDTKVRYVIAELLASTGDESVIKQIEVEAFTDDRFNDFPTATVTKQIIDQIRENLIHKLPSKPKVQYLSSQPLPELSKLLEQWEQANEWTTKLDVFNQILQIEAFDKIRWLDNLLDKSTPGWRSAYIRELSNYSEQCVVDTLATLLKEDTDPDLRYVAARALANNGDASALAALTHAVQHDTGTDYEGRPIASVAAQAIEAIRTRTTNLA